MIIYFNKLYIYINLKKIKSKRRIKKIFKKRRKKHNFNIMQEDVQNNADTTIYLSNLNEEEKEYKIIFSLIRNLNNILKKIEPGIFGNAIKHEYFLIVSL